MVKRSGNAHFYVSPDDWQWRLDFRQALLYSAVEWFFVSDSSPIYCFLRHTVFIGIPGSCRLHYTGRVGRSNDLDRPDLGGGPGLLSRPGLSAWSFPAHSETGSAANVSRYSACCEMGIRSQRDLFAGVAGSVP